MTTPPSPLRRACGHASATPHESCPTCLSEAAAEYAQRQDEPTRRAILEGLHQLADLNMDIQDMQRTYARVGASEGYLSERAIKLDAAIRQWQQRREALIARLDVLRSRRRTLGLRRV